MMIVFLGLSITSSWGNGHATTYRALLRSLRRRGHDVVFLERDTVWYAPHRDLLGCDYCTISLYESLDQLRDEHEQLIASADAVIVGSYVPDGVAVGAWVQAVARGVICFYDIDTPITLEKLDQGDEEYLSPSLIPGYDIYFSFTGGRALKILESRYRSPRARPLYCSVDIERYYPEDLTKRWAMGYLGTYSADRQAPLQSLLLGPASERPESRFVVAGPQYPLDTEWPRNVERINHLAPPEHRAFYCSQQTTLNITRRAMRRLGHAPSVRLFEAAACGVCVTSDSWPGIEELLEPGTEILLVENREDVLRVLDTYSDEDYARIGRAGRRRVLAQHTADHRAEELERHILGAGRPVTAERAG